MIILVHLLEHIGLPSGVAIGLVIAAKKALTSGIPVATAEPTAVYVGLRMGQ
jgi:hypothetical protein